MSNKFDSVKNLFRTVKPNQLGSMIVLSLLILMGISLFFWKPWVKASTPIDSKLEEQILKTIRKHPEVIIESIQAYQQQQKTKLQEARQTFIEDINKNPEKIIGNSPTTGAKDAKVILIEFSDFQCPFCAKAHKTVKQFMDKNGDKVKLVYKYLPLASIHPQAIPAAEAAWAANEQGKFWQYYDALFEQQERLGEDLYLEIAKNLNLDIDKFNQDRKNASSAIQKDLELAQILDISGTPFFIMNGTAFSGAVELSVLEEKLAAELSKK